MRDVIVITGGAGFVGSSLALYLRDDYPGVRIVAFDNLKRRGSELNLCRLKKRGIEFVHGDIRNPEDLDQIREIDILVDCAAEPSVLAGYEMSPKYILNTNLLGTVNSLELARRYGADVIFLSTSRVYPIRTMRNLKYEEGDTRFVFSAAQSITGVSERGITENVFLEGARSIYGASKLSSELILMEYIDMFGIKGVINRCGVLTGPWQMGKADQGFVALWLAKHVYGGELAYIGYGGSGKQVRDILHVSDLYNLLKIQLDDIDRYSGTVYNVGGGENISISLLELTRICEDLTGKKINIKRVDETRLGDIPIYVSDFRKISSATGWVPKQGVKDIISGMLDWINSNKEYLRPILA